MNLADCRVPYLVLPNTVLKLHSKTEILIAIELYSDSLLSRHKDNNLDGKLSPYQRRQRSEILSALERKGVILTAKDSDGYGYDLLALADRAEGRITIPAQF